MSSESLRTAIVSGPHWRVTIRPAVFEAEHIANLAECMRLVERAKVRLRGWDYPSISGRDEQTDVGESWIGSWADFMGHREMWRMYQSGQFLHLFAVEEAVEPGWRDKLAATWRFEVPGTSAEDVPGFISIVNFLWTMTEVFEFAARLVEAGLYQDVVKISVGLNHIGGFRLSEQGRALYHDYATTEASLSNEWEIAATDLLTASAEKSLAATVWFFERFRWLGASPDLLRAEQNRLLERTF